MILLRQVRKAALTIGLVLFISTAIAISFASGESWAATSFTQNISHFNHLHDQLATMDQAKIIAKDVEGKTQAAIGNMTGDPKDQMMGKAKQAESRARNTAADMKDKMALKGRAKAMTKNIEGKVQAASGKATGNRKNQVAGSANQVESQARNTVEDVKDKVRDMLN